MGAAGHIPNATIRYAELAAALLVLTVFATVMLLAHMPTISRMAALAADGSSAIDFGAKRFQPLVHAAGGALVLVLAMVFSVYKPWGRRAA